MIAILVFANWAAADSATWMIIFEWKWQITSVLAIAFAALLVLRWQWSVKHVLGADIVVLSALIAPDVPQLPFAIGVLGTMWLAILNEQDQEWVAQTWDFTKQIMPLLLAGVFIAGLLLGRPGYHGLIPDEWVNMAVGGNSFLSTLLASVLGAFMYFSTLTEVPIVEGLLGAGMGKGEGAGVGAFVGGSRPIATKYAGYPDYYWKSKNTGLSCTCCYVNGNGVCLW